MDSEFRKALTHTIELWIETGRSGDPNVSFSIGKLEGLMAHIGKLEGLMAHIDKMEGLMAHVAETEAKLEAQEFQLHAATVERDAALHQMRENAVLADRAEAKLELLDG